MAKLRLPDRVLFVEYILTKYGKGRLQLKPDDDNKNYAGYFILAAFCQWFAAKKVEKGTCTEVYAEGQNSPG